MHGILLHKEGRFSEAVVVFERAEALGHRAAASNRGNSLLDLGRLEEALHAQELAVERDPECAGAHYNLALTRLRMGDWRQGWEGYEARWRFREVHRRPRVFCSRGGRARRLTESGFCSTPSRVWATPSSSAVTPRWWRLVAAT
jgi:tetratricopeptide (TPR) repeat protein